MIKNKFAKWIEWLLDLLPLFAVLFSCLYVTFNKNAYESYSYQNNLNQVLNITSTDNLIENKDYYLTLLDDSEVSTNANSGRIFFNSTNLLDKIATFDQSDYSSVNAFSFGYLQGYYAKNCLALWSDTTLVKYWVIGVDQPLYLNSTLLTDIYFNFKEKTTSSNTVISQWSLIQYVYTNNGTLDNNFEYSLSKFNDLGFDKLNFINWFTGLFLNGTSNVYTTFINGYLNYFLLVECTYVLPMVLYWFIHLGERLISKLEYGGDK